MQVENVQTVASDCATLDALNDLRWERAWLAIFSRSALNTSTLGMEYRTEAARLLDEAVECLMALDALSEQCQSHHLSSLRPLSRRLEVIAADLRRDNRLGPAITKTDELIMRLIGNGELADPAYRSLVAGVLGKYSRRKGSPQAKLGGLRGGRPRKDGQPVRTLESKGYSAEFLPPAKIKGLRQHPHVRDYLRAAGGAASDKTGMRELSGTSE